MSSEKFLAKFFEKLTKLDFRKDMFLSAFYKFFRKSESTDLFSYYIDYLLRNREFADDNERVSATKDLYDKMRDEILFKDEDAPTDIGFVSKEERKEASERHQVKSVEVPRVTGRTADTIRKGPVKVNKAKALRVLSAFIKQSNIITYEDPNEISNEHDEKFRDDTQARIADEIVNEDGRALPVPQKDAEFGKRSDMMNIWRDTESKCSKLCEERKLDELISKLFFIDTKQLESRPNHVKTVWLEETKDLLPVETFVSGYSKKKYDTVVKLTNTVPIDEAVNRAKQKIKVLYICAGSQMVQGGNSDQGIDTQESMLYMTSTYSVGIGKGLHVYPLSIDQVLICPNVLVFKDSKYQELPMSQYQKIAVMCCPNQWRPKLSNLKTNDLSNEDPKTYLYDIKTTFIQVTNYKTLAQAFANSLEMALFLGYDTIVLDDRAIEDNLMPAHQMAKMLKEVLKIYSGRFKEVIIAASKAASFNVFRHYFSV